MTVTIESSTNGLRVHNNCV